MILLDRAAFVTSQAAPSSLSAQLRAQTAPLHEEIEALLGLPGAIRSADDYVAWLGRFLGLYEPLERSLAAFSDWHVLGIACPSCSHTTCLLDDLAALGAEQTGLPRASLASLTDLPSFPHALGARYVLEGARLGGRVVLRDVEARLGAPIAGATRFFGDRGEAVGPMWQSFRAALNEFGRERPQLTADVVSGAERAFRAMLAWFAPFCAARACQR